MKRTFRRLAIFFGLVLLLALYNFRSAEAGPRVIRYLKSRGVELGVLLDIQRLQFTFPLGVKLDGLGIVFPAGGVPVSLFFETANASLRILPLFYLQGRTELHADVYGGKLDSEISRSLSGSEMHFQLKGERISLAGHPAMSGLGITGLADFRIETEVSPNNTGRMQVEKGLYRLDLKQAELTNGIQYSAIKLPPIRDINVILEATQNLKRLIIEQAELVSSAGSATANGHFTLSSAGALNGGSVNVKISLTNEGSKSVGPYLALAAQTDVNNPARNWTWTIQQEPTKKIQSFLKAEAN